MPRRTLTLTEPQRRELEQVRDRERRPYLRERAAALLHIAAGRTPHAVARQGLWKPRDPDTVYAWLTRYQQQGLAGLVQRPRGHRGFSPSAGHRTRRDGAPRPSDPRPAPGPVAVG